MDRGVHAHCKALLGKLILTTEGGMHEDYENTNVIIKQGIVFRQFLRPVRWAFKDRRGSHSLDNEGRGGGPFRRRMISDLRWVERGGGGGYGPRRTMVTCASTIPGRTICARKSITIESSKSSAALTSISTGLYICTSKTRRPEASETARTRCGKRVAASRVENASGRASVLDVLLGQVSLSLSRLILVLGRSKSSRSSSRIYFHQDRPRVTSQLGDGIAPVDETLELLARWSAVLPPEEA